MILIHPTTIYLDQQSFSDDSIADPVWFKNSLSSRGTVVILEQAANTLTTLNRVYLVDITKPLI